MTNNHFRPHHSNQVPADLSHFWVVTCLSNSPRYRRRYELYRAFAAMCECAGVNLVTVELAFGDRTHMVTDPENPRHLRLRSYEELFHKENLINLGIQRARHLDSLIDKVAWIDADMRPARAPRDWFEETWHELQHYKFVQMYSEFYDFDYHHNLLGGGSPSFMGAYMKNGMLGPNAVMASRPSNEQSGSIWYGPPGGAWAADIRALDDIGMLPDFCILGSGDWHLACALTGSMSKRDPEMVSRRYSERLFEIQSRCDRWIKRDVGVVRGAMFHDNHGPKASRKYRSRKTILTRNCYDPGVDIKYDHQGVLMLETHSERQIRLRDETREYFRERNDDTPEYKK